MKLELAAIVLALAIAPATDAGAKCRRVEQRALVLTKADSKIAPDGGVLVGWEDTTDDIPPAEGDPSNQPKWTATLAGKPVALHLTQVAPGLTVYQPTKPVAGKLVLQNGKTTMVTVTVDSAKSDALPAPKITHVVSSQHEEFRGMGTTVEVSVDSVPDEAIALIVTPAGTDAHATSWGRVAHDKVGATKVVVFESPGHCGGLPVAMAPPAAGKKATFAWVDASGRLSAATAPITVEQGAKP